MDIRMPDLHDTQKAIKQKVNRVKLELFAPKAEEPQEAQQQLTLSEQEAKNIVFEAVLYCLFLLIFTFLISLSRDNEESFMMRDALADIYTSEEFYSLEVYKNFDSIDNVEELYQWLVGPFMAATYSPNMFNTTTTPVQPGYMYGVNKLLGVVRFRQMRMGKDSCTLRSEWKDDFGGDCIGSYDSDTLNKDPYGGPDGTLYRFYDEEEAGGTEVWGELGLYGNAGHVVDITGTDYFNSLQQIKALIDNEYIDLMTRMLIIDFGLYNANTNLYGDFRFLLEFPPTGSIIPSFKARIMNLNRYDGAMGGFVAFLEISTYTFVVYYTVQELREIKMFMERSQRVKYHLKQLGFSQLFFSKRDIHSVIDEKRTLTDREKYQESIKVVLDPLNLDAITSPLPMTTYFYFSDWSNFFDFLNLTLFYASFTLRMLTIGTTASTDWNQDSKDQYVDVQTVSDYYQMEQYCNASNAFLSWFKIFKYLRISRRMSQLIDTLAEGAGDIGYFMIIFAIIFLSFAISGHVAFGVDVREFRTINQSALVLFRGLTEGSLDFYTLYDANRILGPLYYATFFILAFFVLMNMFLAIINQSYTTVQEDLKKRKGMDIMKIFWRALRKGASQRLQSLMGDLGKVVQPNLIPKPKAVIKEIDNLLLTARMADGWLDAEELAETILQSTGLAPNAALALSRRIIREHDQDNDGRLSIQEFAVIKDRVAEQLSEVKNRVKLSQQYQYVSKIETRLDSMLFRLRYASQLGEMLFLSDFVGGKDSALPPDPDKYRNAVVRLQSWARGTMVRKRFKRKRARQREALSGRTPILSPLSPRGTDRIDSPFAAAAVAASASASGYGSDRDLSHSLSAAADVFRENRERKKQDRIAALNLEASV
eukprot:TRINITY_DN267_c0_g1::TRINITY_DN267_c0_g1_i1::g.1709::m.1709 TRINITY_DN267_c0_g1::TRINITY_DN267_c0_g1_i1::g.1709  ORF type:complete len:877 (-),score=257.62,sp/Q4GZT3/PKD2_BOVIN/26.14/1e-52,PKD_channel/PF08016.7/4.8e-37,PKD_channel/PF08016.7/2.8e-34,Ion_trans/PF00520.26/2.4e+03,Ion_trans/PF00520.26/5.7e-15,EF-hand_1/PF00036.27/3.1e+03,EF-hand_1/PF00036.27/0.0021,IQ/PF00612.22/0.0018,EF-hand_7/PF13499.1/0.0027,EF-hand_8/PF13833.1/0.014,EF-hand_6/PF13405.1/4.5e+02,EF-hand_6/PF13405.1/0.45,EF-hand_5